jgi:hypothetical protein
MAGLRTEYEFVLPRGYLDDHGALHTRGTMRLATARDELEPLRDPTITGPDDPRLTILVLARVVSRLGSMELVTPREVEGLFAVDLAYLQDFYGVINFGSDADIESMLAAQAGLEQQRAAAIEPPPDPAQAPPAQPGPSGEAGDEQPERQSRRGAIEEVPATPR